MPRFIITALGSYGDVHPMVGLGAALASRGHSVHVITNPYFEDVVNGAGLRFVPIGTKEEYIRLSQHPDLWHPTRGPRMVMEQAALRVLRPLYDEILAHFVPGETVLCAHCLDFASRIVGETHAAPVASIIFAPAVLWSAYDSPRLAGALLGPRVPRWLKSLQFWVGDTVVMEYIVCGALNQFRRKLNLRPVHRIFERWLFRGGLVLGLFPDWFGPHQPDWPPNVQVVGFPLWDSAPEAELSSSVREFLASGSRPIAFSPGSANRAAQRFFASAVEACERLGCRGILLTKYEHQLPATLPPTIRHFGFIPLSKLLPHTAAMVHHGGIGSCAQGLAAGIPQIVQPMAYDQFDNSRRLARLGVAREVAVKRFSGQALADVLAPLLDSPEVATRCRQLAAQCHGQASLAAACDQLEELARSKPRN